MIITIDGPAGSGKGTLARRLAQDLDFYHLDTGLLYRAVAFVAQQKGVDLSNEESLANIARSLQLTQLSKPLLSNETLGRAASDVARLPQVRIALLDLQRNVAHHPPLFKRGCVLDGRDTGTIVCPDADIKFFLTATLDERAKRRVAELQAAGLQMDLEKVSAMMQLRDNQDATRVVAPMRKAADAHEIDTTYLMVDEILFFVHQHIDHLKSQRFFDLAEGA